MIGARVDAAPGGKPTEVRKSATEAFSSPESNVDDRGMTTPVVVTGLAEAAAVRRRIDERMLGRPDGSVVVKTRVVPDGTEVDEVVSLA